MYIKYIFAFKIDYENIRFNNKFNVGTTNIIIFFCVKLLKDSFKCGKCGNATILYDMNRHKYSFQRTHVY